jgi:hypothetical protein
MCKANNYALIPNQKYITSPPMKIRKCQRILSITHNFLVNFRKFC